MARPREIDKRRDLARRAIAVLEEKGLAISTEQLAREVGVKRPTLLYHFGTVAELVRFALADLLTEQATFVDAKVEEHSHPIDRLYARVVAIHAFNEGRERRVAFLSQAAAVTSGADLATLLRSGAELFAPQRRALVAALEDGIAEGTVAPCDAKALVALVRGIIDGLTIQRVADQVDLEPIHRFLWDNVLAPLRKKKASATRMRARTATRRT